MANVVSISPANLRVGPTIQQLAAMPVSIAVSDVYATATGGITVDFATILATIPVETRPKFTDVVSFQGAAKDAALIGYTVVATKTSTDAQFTVRLFKGETSGGATNEHADGATAAGLTITGLLFFAPGAQN